MRRRTGSVQNRYVESCNKNFINRQWPLATHCACAHGMLIRPIQVEVILYLGQNRYRKPRCRIGLWAYAQGLRALLPLYKNDKPKMGHYKTQKTQGHISYRNRSLKIYKALLKS